MDDETRRALQEMMTEIRLQGMMLRQIRDALKLITPPATVLGSPQRGND